MGLNGGYGCALGEWLLLAKASVELFYGWMVDMVELGGSMCYGAKSVLRCFVA